MTKIFVTGATGLVGTALIPKLIAAGHTVIALARSPESIAKLEAIGAKGVQGSITDLDVCAAAAKDADTVVHLAFDHGLAFSGKFAEACELDRAVIRAMVEALLASPSSTTKKFVLASGTLGLPPNGDETSEAHRNPAMPRHQSTDLLFSYVPKGLRAVLIRLAPITYGPAKPHDFLGWQIAKAKENGYAAYTDSDNAWPTCDVKDMADLYVRAIESDKLPNPCTLHGLAEEGVPVKDVAELIARKTGVEAKAVPKDKIAEVLGFAGNLMSIAHKVKADWTRKVTGWEPKEPGLLAQMESYSYA